MNRQQPVAFLPSALHRALSSSVAFFAKYAVTALTGSVGSMSAASLMKHFTASPTQSRFSSAGVLAFSFSSAMSQSLLIGMTTASQGWPSLVTTSGAGFPGV